MRPINRLLATTLLAAAVLAIGVSPAWAHTGFESSNPADGATVNEPVDAITLVFSGEAEPTGPGFEVLDAAGALREPTEATTSDGTTWVLRFEPALAGGVVGVRWMVKAPDAHPIDGSFSFTVAASLPAAAPGPDPADSVNTSDPTGRAPADSADSANSSDTAGGATGNSEGATDTLQPGEVDLDAFLDTGGDTTAVPQRLGAAARLVTLIGTLVGVGALVFAAAVLRGDHRDVRYVLRWVRRAGILVVIGASAEFVAQVVVEGGGDWTTAWSLSNVGSVLGSSFGVAVGLRILGGAALASEARLEIAQATEVVDPVAAIKELVSVGAGPASAGPADHDAPRHGRSPAEGDPYLHHGDQAWRPTVGSAGAALGALAVVVAHLFDGHTVTKGDRTWTALADVVHVAGGAIWAGGVFMLATILWRRHRQGRQLRALQLAIRFSVVATLALVAVGIAGLVLTVIVLDSPSELWATEWGRTLIAKTLFVGVAAAAGAYNHNVLIPQLQYSPDDPVLADRFRVIVTGEAIALVAVLAATALLMGAAS